MTAKWCAPNRENSRITCYTLEQLKNIAREYNKNCSPKQRIKIKRSRERQGEHVVPGHDSQWKESFRQKGGLIRQVVETGQ